MKKILFFILAIAIPFMSFSQAKVALTIGSRTMTATLVDNGATRELVSLLEKSPITIQMSDYGGFEKVGALPQSFPTSNAQISTQPGDIMLYQGDNMVIFYGTNSWSYTPLGKIDNASASAIKQFLGSGEISLTMSLESSAGFENVSADSPTANEIYDMKGERIAGRPRLKGIYLVNGKKHIIK